MPTEGRIANGFSASGTGGGAAAGRHRNQQGRELERILSARLARQRRQRARGLAGADERRDTAGLPLAVANLCALCSTHAPPTRVCCALLLRELERASERAAAAGMTEGRISAADGRRASWDLELDSMDKRTRFQVNRVDTANADEGEMEKLTSNPDQDDLPDAAGECRKFAHKNWVEKGDRDFGARELFLHSGRARGEKKFSRRRREGRAKLHITC